MSEYLKIIYNNKTEVEYDRASELSAERQQFLDMMDKDMDAGININGDIVEIPDQNHRAKYMAMNLVDGLKRQDEALVSIACAYLANRIPELNEIRAKETGNEISMELIYAQ